MNELVEKDATEEYLKEEEENRKKKK